MCGAFFFIIVPCTKIYLLLMSKYHNKAFDVNAIFKGTQKRAPKNFRVLTRGLTLQVNSYFLVYLITVFQKKMIIL